MGNRKPVLSALTESRFLLLLAVPLFPTGTGTAQETRPAIAGSSSMPDAVVREQIRWVKPESMRRALAKRPAQPTARRE